jgi:hypothetical protein
MRIHLARMHRAALAHECKHRRRLRGPCGGPHGARRARMHQFVMLARQIAIVDEEILLQRHSRVAALEIAGAIGRHAVAQGQILRARRSTDGIGLHEAEFVDRALQGSGLEQRTRDGVAAQVIQGDRHAAMIFQSPGARFLVH